MNNELRRTIRGKSGFSVIELLIVLAMLSVLTVMSLPYLYNSKRLYKSEDQALKVIDLMREAGQIALNRRRTIRFEIDYTDNAALIIDENTVGTPADDALIKRIPLEKVGEVRIDVKPAGVTRPIPPDYADITSAADALGHRVGATTVTGHTVWVARFRSDGTVVNAANLPISTTLYVWPPLTAGSTTPRNKTEVRAITIFGGSGAIRYWKHNGTSFDANQ